MEVKVNVLQFPADDSFAIECPKLDAYDLSSFGIMDPVSAVETFFSDLQGQIEIGKAKTGYDYLDYSVLNGLKLHFEAKFELTDELKAYFNALNIMLDKHSGQTDKGGNDYYFHPVRVSEISKL